MSLIDEALKRARQEADRQKAAERETRYARVPVYVPPARAGRRWLVPALAACLGAGLAAGVVISRPAPPPLAPSPATAPALPGSGGAPAERPAQVVSEKPPGVSEKPPVVAEKEPRREPPPSPSPGEGEGSDGRGGQGVRASSPAPQPAPAPPAPAPREEPIALPNPPREAAAPAQPVQAPQPSSLLPPAPSLPQPPPASGEPRSYVREVPAPGGAVLRLNGIAFSAQPVALFGDKVVAPGESIGGFTVVEIEAKRVKLQSPGGTVYVTLK